MAVIPCSRGLVVLTTVLVLASLQFTGASEPLDPFGNVAVKWDIVSWTGDGYVVNVSLDNTPQSQGNYHLGWTWSKKEVIWTLRGGQATEQGDCTGLLQPPPVSCVRTPDIIVDHVDSVPSFEMTVGSSGNTNITVQIPQKLILKSPGPVYTCSDLKKVAPTRYPLNNGRHTQAYVTWNATCSP